MVVVVVGPLWIFFGDCGVVGDGGGGGGEGGGSGDDGGEGAVCMFGCLSMFVVFGGDGGGLRKFWRGRGRWRFDGGKKKRGGKERKKKGWGGG